MGILKLIIATLVIGSIAVIIRELLKRNKKKQIAADLNEQLDKVNEELLKADVEDDVIEARTALLARRVELDRKLADLEAGIIPEPEAPVEDRSLNGGLEGEAEPIKAPAPKKKMVAKKKVAKKKVVKKKAAPKKKTPGKS